MALFTVDSESCTKDGLCARACPAGLVYFKNDGVAPTPVRDAEKFCIRCGHCVAVCPKGALTHRDFDPAALAPVKTAAFPDPEGFAHLLQSRRSVRVYKSEPVDREVLSELMALAGYAPTGHNRRPVAWIAASGPDKVKELAGLTVDFMRDLLESDPEAAKALSMDRVVRAWEKGVDVVLRGAPHVVVAHGPENDPSAPPACTITLAWLELAAASRGLGACWAGWFNLAATRWPPLQKALGLPSGRVPLGAMMLGKPAFGYRRIPARKTPPVTWL